MEIFVFGSNLAGRHGRGAALHARKHHGARYGQGAGLQGLSYGIPTKDRDIKVLPLAQITEHVETFKDFARSNPDMTFKVTLIGCGLAGYSPREIGPLFKGSPDNVRLPIEFGGTLDWKAEAA